jgi:sialidase-1
MKIVTVARSTPELPRKSEADVIELRDGRLFMAYMEFSGNGSDHAVTRLVAEESADGGATWSNHRVLAETAPGDMNVYSPNLVRRSDGAILFLCMRQHSPKGEANYASSQVSWISTDECQSFSPFVTFAEHQPFNLCNAVVRRLDSGRLLLPVCVVGDVTRLCTGYAGTVLWSDDGGATWSVSPHRIRLPMRGVMEPHVEETRDGRVLMVMRNQLGALFFCESRDAGLTWSLPQSSGMSVPESCPELRRHPATGDLLLIWNAAPYDPCHVSHFGKRTPLSAAISRDNGRTWSAPRAIEDDPGRAFSNPGCRFLSNGDCLVHYWTCEYLSTGRMQNEIELRAARLPADWFGVQPNRKA